MAFDPNMEDYMRLSLHYASSLKGKNPFEAARAATTFANKYETSRDSLEQNDIDRAFYLVYRATSVVDYQLPFTDEQGTAPLIEQAGQYLAEALELDPNCWDAKRMAKAGKVASPNEYARYLADHVQEVRDACTKRSEQLEKENAASELNAAARAMHAGVNQSALAMDAELLAIAQQLAMRPYLRWLAALAAMQLACGRYSLCIKAAKEALELDESDPGDVSFTLALAYAKLEDAEAFEELRETHPQPNGAAWFMLAEMALLFKQKDEEGAAAIVSELLQLYPNAGFVLAMQSDIPTGIYSRILVEPGSEDELILAVSEATVILQEGCDVHERGTLGSWLAAQPGVKEALSS